VLIPGGYEIKGIIVLTGYVEATMEGLGRLIQDERVYLADILAVEVAQEVAEQFGVNTEKVNVFIPSPHWLVNLKAN
jgi:hypothetical protein